MSSTITQTIRDAPHKFIPLKRVVDGVEKDSLACSQCNRVEGYYLHGGGIARPGRLEDYPVRLLRENREREALRPHSEEWKRIHNEE